MAHRSDDGKELADGFDEFYRGEQSTRLRTRRRIGGGAQPGARTDRRPLEADEVQLYSWSNDIDSSTYIVQ